MSIRRASLLAFLAPLACLAQLAEPNSMGIAMGHVHLAVKDVEAQRRFWITVMGGTPLKNGPLDLIQFPGVFIMLRQAEPTGPPAGSVVDHFGFNVKDMTAFIAHCKANNVEPERTANAKQVYVAAPDGIRVEIIADPELDAPVRFNHLHIYAADIPAVQAWYAKTFGAAAGKRPSVLGPGSIDAADLPGGNISLRKEDKPLAPTKGRSLDHIGFEVKNLEAFTKNLEAQGVKFDAPIRQIAGARTKVIFFTDPWGAYIELTESLAP